MMEEAVAFVPGHISGFFQVHDESSDPSRIGSRNCGPCIDAGVTTRVEVESSDSPELDIFINGQEASAETTRAAVGEVLDISGRAVSIGVEHSVRAPMGSGYGMSGAGALGAVLAVSKALNLRLDRSEVLSVAHRAEVICRSGLGDVGAQIRGGMVIGLEPGGPPHGKWEEMDVDEDLTVLCGTEGPLSTSDFLEAPDFRERSKKLGKVAFRDLLENRSIENFMRSSREFSKGLGVFDEDFEEIIEEISSRSPFGASAVMLGRAIFALTTPSEVDDLKRVFRDYFDSESIMVTSIDFEGARISD